MKTKLIVLILALSCASQSFAATRSVTSFPVITPVDADYFIFTDTSNSGLFSKATVANTKTALGITDDQTAVEVNITDTGGYYTGTTAEAALQESGATIAGAINLTVDGTTIEQTGTPPNLTIGVKDGVFALAGETGSFAFDTYPTYENSPHAGSGIAVNGTTLAVYSTTASKWLTVSLTDTLDPSPVTYSMNLTITGAAGADKVTVVSTDYTASDTITGLSSATTALTGVPDTGREVACVGAAVTGTSPNYQVDMSDSNEDVTCTFDTASGPSFVGAPGTAETMEAPGFTLAEFSEVDSSGYITPGSSTAAHGGTYSAEFANTASAGTYSHYVAADIGTTDSGFTLTWWWKTPNNGTVFSNAIFFAASNSATASNTSAFNSIVNWDGNGTNGKIGFSTETSTGQTLSTNTFSYNTWYKFVLAFSDGASSTLSIYNAADSLVETLTKTLDTQAPRYFYWFDSTSLEENTYLDDIQYDSTNP